MKLFDIYKEKFVDLYFLNDKKIINCQILKETDDGFWLIKNRKEEEYINSNSIYKITEHIKNDNKSFKVIAY